MNVHVSSDRRLWFNSLTLQCALGKGGVRKDKTEGDGATPVGCFPFRRVLFRPDRVDRPTTRLPVDAISADTGWCDDPTDPKYNRLIKLPFDRSHEKLWRDDNLYDIVVVLGYNDDPPEPLKGSAIFMHIARSNYGPTEGCVALRQDDLEMLLRELRPGDDICITDAVDVVQK